MELNCLLVPTLALDVSLLDRLAKSIDYPVKNKIVVNNGNHNALDEWLDKNSGWHIVESGENLGVAGSWNLAPKIFKDDCWLIVNDDQELQPGCLEKICKNSRSDVHINYVNPYRAFDIFVWTRKGVEDFGLFDENFYPAYYEDWEMRLRFEIAGAKEHFIGDESFPVKHGKPFPAGKEYELVLKEFDPINREYFMEKWGMVGDKNPVFETPFNINVPLYYWCLDKERRQKMKVIWEEFFHAENVSLY